MIDAKHLEQDLESATDLLNDKELEAVSGGVASLEGCIRLPTIFKPPPTYPIDPFRDVFQKYRIGV